MTGPRKPRKASWRELPPAEMAAHLIATPTIADGVWTSEPRLLREKRSDFVRRVLLGETPEPEPETSEAEAAEVADQKCYLLNTDGGNSGNPLGRAAIGALLRTRSLVTMAQISKAIGPATHNVGGISWPPRATPFASRLTTVRRYPTTDANSHTCGLSVACVQHRAPALERGSTLRMEAETDPLAQTHRPCVDGEQRAAPGCAGATHQLSAHSKTREARSRMPVLSRMRGWPPDGLSGA